MRQKSVLALVVVTGSLIAAVCFAMYRVADRGMWPDSWPKQLDRLRPQARTLDHGDFTVYEIPFTKRAEFESAWPHILTVKSSQAPLVLLSSPDKWLGHSIAAGVRIRCPPTVNALPSRARTIPRDPNRPFRTGSSSGWDRRGRTTSSRRPERCPSMRSSTTANGGRLRRRTSGGLMSARSEEREPRLS